MKFKNITYTFFILAAFSVTLFACTNDKDDDPEPDPVDVKTTELVYSPNTLTVNEGSSASSSAPSVKGTTPISYTATVSPANSEVSINDATGVVTVSDKSAKGTFIVSVTATNTVGAETFSNALTITVQDASSGNSTTFNGDIRSIITTECSPCHVAGGTNTNYSVYNAAKNNVSGIINRIKRDAGTPGFMPRNGTKLDAATIALIEKWETDGLLEN